ncbi:MAG: response regulator [Oscillospiraceae bacterium]|nr:response regulator [Oscillospiraceae bacterium]
MMKIISVDDEKGCLDAFRMICSDISDVEYLGGFNNPLQALEFLQENDVDIAFLDIEMPVMTGIELAKKINELQKDISVVFVTAYEHYAVQAFAVDACGYILKPYEPSEIIQKIRTLDKCSPQDENKVEIYTFGQLEVSVNGKLLKFSSGKSRELMALLIDKRGEVITTQQAVAYLWPNRECDAKTKALYRMAVSALKKLLEEVNAIDILIDQWGSKGINPDKVKCDCWRWMDNESDDDIIPERYFAVYDWAEKTRERLATMKKVRSGNAESGQSSESVNHW